nr:sulfite exporter TauE/SafE family protein [Chloroflexota bacterium]
MSLVLIAFLVSIAAGGFGALVGIGGGLIIVPVLTVLLDVPIKTAIAASLIGVIATSM